MNMSDYITYQAAWENCTTKYIFDQSRADFTRAQTDEEAFRADFLKNQEEEAMARKKQEEADMNKKVKLPDWEEYSDIFNKTAEDKERILDMWRKNIPKIPVEDEECDGAEDGCEPPKSDTITQQFRQAKELQDKGKSEVEISKELGKPLDWVKGSLLIITKLPAKVHDAIDRKLFSRTTALQLLLVKPERLEVIVDAAIALAEKEGKI